MSVHEEASQHISSVADVETENETHRLGYNRNETRWFRDSYTTHRARPFCHPLKAPGLPPRIRVFKESKFIQCILETDSHANKLK